LFTIGLALALSWEHLWSTPRRWVLVATCLYLVSGVLSLFYDIPRKRLSRYSRMFLIVGTLGPFALLVLAILWKKLAL
jgi:tryptophan-rich sensory protein